MGVLSCLIENSNLKGKIRADVLVLEIDERYVKKVFEFIKPKYFIINNLTRDQLARNGHFDIVLDDIKKYITDDIHLFLNGDDPIVNKISLEHKGLITYYGLKKTEYSQEESKWPYLDLLYCPVCNTKLNFSYFHYDNLGSYCCPNNDFGRPKIDFEATLISDDSFKVANQIIKMNNVALYNVYNLLVSYAVAVVDGIPKTNITKSLNELSLSAKRIDSFQIKDKVCTLLISKNESSSSYNQSLTFINKQEGSKTVVIGLNQVSRRYEYKDLSWLWDINFELLNNDKVDKIICVGIYAYDVAIRLKYAGITSNKIIIYENKEEILDSILKYGLNSIYCLACFEIEKTLKNLIKEAQYD